MSPIADSRLRPGQRHVRNRQPGRFRLHGDDRDVMGDNVMQFAGDPSAFTARGVLDQGPDERVLDRPVIGGIPAHPHRDAGTDRNRHQAGEQLRDDR